jgi:fructose-1,6-bisphosphatase/sedoheptulose 1,7-bisphosphatase-like protein
MGITDLNKKYTAFDMTGGKHNNEIIFACAGVTDGYMVKGVNKCTTSGKVCVSSLLMDSAFKKLIRTTSEYLV